MLDLFTTSSVCSMVAPVGNIIWASSVPLVLIGNVAGRHAKEENPTAATIRR